MSLTRSHHLTIEFGIAVCLIEDLSVLAISLPLTSSGLPLSAN